MHSPVYNGSMPNQINRLSRKNRIQNADLEKFNFFSILTTYYNLSSL